jgi:hypothetical protein
MTMKTLAWTLVTAALGFGMIACSGSEPSAGDVEEGELGGCGGGDEEGDLEARSAVKQVRAHLSERGSITLSMAARDPAAVPVGYRPGATPKKFLTSLALDSGANKFTATLNDDSTLSGTFTLSAPRCRSASENLTLKPSGRGASPISFTVSRGHDLDVPDRYGFQATGVEGWSVFNLTLEAQSTQEDGATCNSCPRPRCFGAVGQCVIKQGACVWQATRSCN